MKRVLGICFFLFIFSQISQKNWWRSCVTLGDIASSPSTIYWMIIIKQKKKIYHIVL